MVPVLFPPLVVLPLAALVVVLPAAGFAPPFVVAPLPLPLAAGVADGVAAGAGVGTEVTGVGISGIGFESTLANNSVTLASVAALLRYL